MGVWQPMANALPLPEAYFLGFNSENPLDLANGIVCTQHREPTTVWLVPQVWVHRTNPQHYWIPLWIPAISHQGQCQQHPSHQPYIPLSMFEPLSANCLMTHALHEFEAFLAYDFAAYPTWEAYYQACHRLLDDFSQQTWAEKLKAKGYLLTDKTFWVEESRLKRWLPMMQDYTPELNGFTGASLLEDYARLEDLFEESASAALPTAPMLGRYPNHQGLTAEAYQAIKALDGQRGMMTLSAPVGTAKATVMAAIVASLVVRETVLSDKIPYIYRLAPYQSDFSSTIQPFSAANFYPKGDKKAQAALVIQCQALRNQQLADKSALVKALKHELDLQYENYITGLDLLNKYIQERSQFDWGKDGDCQYAIQTLQKEDARLEEAFNQLLAQKATLEQQQSESLISKLFTRGNKTADQLAKIAEQVRQHKVKRTKIHQQLVRVTEEMHNATQAKLWQQWLKDNELCLPEGLFEHAAISETIENIFSEKLWQLTQYYWLAKQGNKGEPQGANLADKFLGHWQLCRWQVSPTPGWQPVNKIEKTANLLIIDEANGLLPQQLPPLLCQAKTVLLVGDEKDMPPPKAI